MTDLVKVRDHDNLVRDPHSRAIINTDKNAYTIYMQRVKEARKSNDELKYAVREINSIKVELTEIKELLGKLVK